MPGGARRRRLRRRRDRRLRLRDLQQEVHGLPRRRREPRDAHRGELGVVPAVREGVGRTAPGGTAATSSAAATRASRTSTSRRPRRACCSSTTTSGWCAPTGRRSTGRRRSRAPRSTPGVRSRPSSSVSPTRSTRATGSSRSPVARLLLRLRRRLAELPDRLRLRLDLLPRGRVGGRQPSVGVLGEDEQVTRPLSRHLAPRRLAPAAHRAARRLQRLRRRPPEPGPGRPPPPVGGRADARPRGAPAASDVRACYALAYDEAVAPTKPPQAGRCDREHTAITFHVGTLDAVVDGHLLAVDSRLVQDAGRRPSVPTLRRLRRRHPRGAAAEHAPGRLVHPDRRAVRPRGGLVPLRRDRGGRRPRSWRR